MEAFKDVVGSVREWARVKFSTPFFGAFLAAWAATNWRVILVLTGDAKWNEKITWLDQRMYPEWWYWVVYCALIPTAFALGYVFLSPWALRKLSLFAQAQRHETTRRLLEIDKVEPLSPERATTLIQERISAALELKSEKARYAALETEYLSQIAGLEQKVIDLKHAAAVLPPAPAAPPPGHVNLVFKERKAAPPGEGKIYFEESDFVGESGTAPILKHGLDVADARNLAAIARMESPISETDLYNHFKADPHQVGLFISRASALLLIIQNGGGGYSVTGLGHQVVDAAKKRGAIP